MRYIEPPAKDALDAYHSHYRGAILATAHLANWEWCGYCLSAFMPNPGIAVYRPIKNQKVDQLMRSHREKSRMQIVPMREIVKLLARGASGSHFVLLISDQNPDRDGAHWEQFFGIQTAFFKGPAALAHKYDMPVFFIWLERTGRHKYRMHLEPLCMDPREHKPEEITRIYVQKLEQCIRSAPTDWLWTHKRWKHSPPEV
jgi:KDO2-lipid IV(A) lauroyltransferase